jgi:hypothetical protein
MHHQRLSRRLALLGATLALALGVPLGVTLASHQFSDVPTSNPFHGDVSALAASGVTAGCGSGKFCPKANVTREQMAAFMNRLGALSPGKKPVVNAATVGGASILSAVVRENGTLVSGVSAVSATRLSLGQLRHQVRPVARRVRPRGDARGAGRRDLWR